MPMPSEPLIEPGSAFAKLTSLDVHASSPSTARAARGSRGTDAYDVVVIGGGQAGLAVGYHLARQGLRFLILDASERIGDTWRTRWDSLRLFTPAKFDGLEGMPFPGDPDAFPTKDEMADYLQAYARRFELPVRNGVRVTRVARDEDGYLVETKDHTLRAAHVVVAMADYQQPKLPAFAKDLDPGIVQIHSKHYRGPDQLAPGPVLVVGAGNSGAEIAKELACSRPDGGVWLSGRSTGEIPFDLSSVWSRWLWGPLLLRWLFFRVLSIATPLGRKARPKILSKGGPLIRVKSRQLRELGVQRIARTDRVQDGKPVSADGRVLDVATVVWCTGFEPGFSWIDLPLPRERGVPVHAGGVVCDEPGLYFVGLHFGYALSSAMIHGVSRDAARIVSTITQRVAVRPRVATAS